jgi:hypothetical protein
VESQPRTAAHVARRCVCGMAADNINDVVHGCVSAAEACQARSPSAAASASLVSCLSSSINCCRFSLKDSRGSCVVIEKNWEREAGCVREGVSDNGSHSRTKASCNHQVFESTLMGCCLLMRSDVCHDACIQKYAST